MVLALAATWHNWQAFRVGFAEVKAPFAATAVLAAIYSASYAVLLFTDVDPSHWTQAIRPVTLVTWPIVWSWPAIRAVRTARRIRRRADDIERKIR